MDNVNRLESMHCLYKDRSSLLTSLLHGRRIWNRLVTAFYYIYNPTTCCVNSDVR